MIEKFKNLPLTSKLLVGGAVVMGVIMVCLLVAVVATGGFTNPF